jgi:hypothetical protein
MTNDAPIGAVEKESDDASHGSQREDEQVRPCSEGTATDVADEEKDDEGGH